MQNFFISGTVSMQAHIFQNPSNVTLQIHGHTTESNSIPISQSGTKNSKQVWLHMYHKHSRPNDKPTM